MKIIIFMKLVTLLAITGILSGCGGGSSGGTTIISGVASKGIFKKGATVRIYELKADGTEGELLKESSIIDDSGNYKADLGMKYTGAIIVKVFGAYWDEATNREVLVTGNNPLTAALPASEIVELSSGNAEAKVMVTALTEIAVRKAKASGGLTENAISASNHAVSQLFGVSDVIKTIPAKFDTETMQNSNTSDEQKKYSAVLATVSQYISDTTSNGTPDASDLEKAISQIASSVTVNSGTAPQITDMQVAYNMQKAAANVTTNAHTKSTVSAAGSAAQGAINNLSTEGSASGHKIVTFKLKTVSSSYADKFNGVQANITLPSIHSGSSCAVATSVSNALVQSSTSSGVLSVGFISTAELDLGEFASLYCDVPADAKISAAGFNPVTVVKVVNSRGTALSGVRVEVF